VSFGVFVLFLAAVVGALVGMVRLRNHRRALGLGASAGIPENADARRD
jgi:hypothetical protein